MRIATPVRQRSTGIRRLGRWIHAGVTWDGWLKLGAIATASGVLGGLWFTSHSLDATNRQLGVAEQAEVTNRFSKAVEQLDSDHLDTRIGAIYSLERIAHDSPADRSTVFDVLGAFVRTRAPNTPECSTLPPPHPNPDDLPRLAPDIQSAITVIGRRDTPSVGHVDLSRTCLKGADLRFADLRNVDLEFSSLVWADMRHANLQGATVHLANFHSAYMNGVNLEEARFEVVNFTAALMEDGNIRSAKMINCPLINAVFLGADLKGLEISFSDLSGADFAPEVNLEHSTAAKNLGQAKLEHVHYNNDTTWPKGFTPPENADPGL